MYILRTHTHTQAVGYGLVLLDGNLVNINKLKKLNLSRVDRLFRVSHTKALLSLSEKYHHNHVSPSHHFPF